MNKLDVTYEQACMATPKEEYYSKMLETLVNYNDRNNGLFSNEKIQQAVSRVMAETEEEERDAERNANHMTMDTISPFHNCTISPFHNCTISPSQGEITNVTSIHSTISPSQGEIVSVTSERRISSDMLAETINGFNELTIQSTINDSEEDDA